MTYTSESYNDDYRLFCALYRICTSVGISTTFEKDVYPIVCSILPHEYFSLFVVSLSLSPTLYVINVNFPIRFLPQMSPFKSGTSSQLFGQCMHTNKTQYYDCTFETKNAIPEAFLDSLPIKNMVTHGIRDTNGFFATYSIFGNVGQEWNEATRSRVEMLCPHLHAAVACSRKRSPVSTLFDEKLTVRERQILSLLCQGLGRAEIAKEVNISPWTAKVNIQNILRKLPAKNSRHAVVMALANASPVFY